MIPARAVVLAAGTSSRVGKQKLLLQFHGKTLIEYPIAAAQAWNPIVVAGPEVAAYLVGRSDVEVVRNDEPQLGMSHSLSLANKRAESDAALIVLLGDKPLVRRALIEAICSAAGNADVVYPVHEGVPGHPVWLSARARKFIGDLPGGDTARALREHPELRQRAVQTADHGATFDVDTIAALDG
jgi:CTP:molybdopterin cytidylyltransferase MocA